MPRAAAFSGRTAACLHGATELADLRSPVEVSVPTGVRFGPVAGSRSRQVRMVATEVQVAHRQRCTTGLRTALDIARREAVTAAVAALDVLLARAVVGKGELRESAALDTGRGSRRVRQAVELADPRAESQPESRLRVILALAGLLAQPQYSVRDRDGNFVARVDLAFPDQEIAVEYDGA